MAVTAVEEADVLGAVDAQAGVAVDAIVVATVAVDVEVMVAAVVVGGTRPIALNSEAARKSRPFFLYAEHVRQLRV